MYTFTNLIENNEIYFCGFQEECDKYRRMYEKKEIENMKCKKRMKIFAEKEKNLLNERKAMEDRMKNLSTELRKLTVQASSLNK